MAIALVTNTKIQPSSTTSGGTSSAVDTTGANLIVIAAGAYRGFAPDTNVVISDSKGNTYTPLTSRQASNVAWARLYYCLNPTVGTGHTFSLGSGGTAASLQIAAFSGVATSSAFDKESGNAPGTNGGSTVQPGSLTAAVASSLYVTGLCTTDNSSGTDSINSSFNFVSQSAWASGSYEGSALAYKISSAAENPTWTVPTPGSADIAAVMAIFKPGSGGGTAALSGYSLSASRASLGFSGSTAIAGRSKGMTASRGAFSLTTALAGRSMSAAKSGATFTLKASLAGISKAMSWARGVVAGPGALVARSFSMSRGSAAATLTTRIAARSSAQTKSSAGIGASVGLSGRSKGQTKALGTILLGIALAGRALSQSKAMASMGASVSFMGSSTGWTRVPGATSIWTEQSPPSNNWTEQSPPSNNWTRTT